MKMLGLPQPEKPNCQTATGNASSNAKDTSTIPPSRVNNPAANKAITADAIEPEVGIASKSGITSVSARINTNGRKIHGLWSRNVNRGRKKRSTKRTGLRSHATPLHSLCVEYDAWQ